MYMVENTGPCKMAADGMGLILWGSRAALMRSNVHAGVHVPRALPASVRVDSNQICIVGLARRFLNDAES